jgi:hypothetical protein
MKIVVADTNIYVSAFVSGGKSLELMSAARQKRISLLMTPEIMTEMGSVFHRSKFQKYFEQRGLTPDDIITGYQEVTTLVIAATIPSGVVRDKKDEIILAAAVGGKADYVVTGDKDLLTLEKYQDIAIITVHQLLEILNQENPKTTPP